MNQRSPNFPGAINPGDLVVVMRWPCCGVNIGKIATVKEIHGHAEDGTCVTCQTLSVITGPFQYAIIHTGRPIPLAWLRRIPPLDELDDVKSDQGATV